MLFIVNVTLKSLNLDIMEYDSSFNVKFLERILTLKALVNISIKSQNQLILIVFLLSFPYYRLLKYICYLSAKYTLLIILFVV